VVDLAADLARPEGRGVDVGVGGAGADGGDDLVELPGGDPLPGGLEDLGRRDRARDRALLRALGRCRANGLGGGLVPWQSQTTIAPTVCLWPKWMWAWATVLVRFS
jgi:hypothetical protein